MASASRTPGGGGWAAMTGGAGMHCDFRAAGQRHATGLVAEGRGQRADAVAGEVSMNMNVPAWPTQKMTKHECAVEPRADRPPRLCPRQLASSSKMIDTAQPPTPHFVLSCTSKISIWTAFSVPTSGSPEPQSDRAVDSHWRLVGPGDHDMGCLKPACGSCWRSESSKSSSACSTWENQIPKFTTHPVVPKETTVVHSWSLFTRWLETEGVPSPTPTCRYLIVLS